MQGRADHRESCRSGGRGAQHRIAQSRQRRPATLERLQLLRCDAAFRAEALRLAEQSRSTQAAARALNIDPKRIYKWQKEALTPVATARGAELDPATAAELRQLRAANRRQAQELEILKKAIAIFSQTETP